MATRHNVSAASSSLTSPSQLHDRSTSLAQHSKEFISETNAPQKIARIEFGVLSASDIGRLSHMHVHDFAYYDPVLRTPLPYGPLDRRMGVSDKSALCETCGKGVADCVGHFGHLRLELPCFHIGFIREIVTILQMICKSCSRVLLTDEDRDNFTKRMRKCSNDRLRRAHLFKTIHERCKKKSMCPKCGAFNGTVKKLTGVFKIIHDRFKNARAPIKSKEAFYQQFETALTFNADLRSFVKNAVHDLNPLTVRHMFMNIPDCDLEVLDMPTGRPEDLLITSLLVPPVCIRPSVPMGPSGTNEDDLTIKIGDIIQINLKIKNVIDKHAGQTMTLMELWEFLQAQVAMLINSDMPGFPHSVHNTGKPLRALSQRLKGKQGRFRGNLSGKRVDFSARTVISPDPNLSIEEVGIPVLVAKILTVPERVTVHNLALMRQLVRNGPNVHPGANILERPDGFRVFLKYTDRKKAAAELTVGTLLERHLADGDVVLFNRQPSLHRLSIMCHRVKVRPWRTFRFNTCVCTPYNADFDGDEMNVHVPQTLEARAEALLLMGVRENLMTPKSGEPLVALNQDFLTGSFLITQRDVFFDRTQFVQLVACISDATEKVIIPAPAILKPIQLWTGKQLMSLVFRPNNGMSAYPSNKPWPLLNIELKSKNYDEKAAATCLDARDGYIVVKNSELLCGNLCKNAMGGTKGGIIFVLIRDHSAAAAVTVMNRTVKMISRWMLHRGFSVGIDDVTPSAHLIAKKKELTTLAYAKCDEKIADYHAGRLEPRSGCTAAQTIEQELLGCLKIREEIAEICLRELSYHNAPLIMAVCGSKGNKENIAQMTALLGQQAISGQRITNGFGTRTLPQFAPGSLTPAAKGFVQNSFYSGLTGTEFFFHTMGGREGLVDTAVKTAETGYMQRRLMKALEDLCAQYDKTVRNSETTVVQFTYGDDGLDPIMMEQYTLGKEKRHGPADLPRLLEHIRNTQPCVDERGLSAEQIRTVALTVQDMTRFAGTSTKFRGTVADHLNSIAKSIDEVVAGFADLDMSAKDNKKGKKTKTDNINSTAELVTERIHRLTPTQLESYLEGCASKYLKAMIEPGTAVGAIGGQSIGEPGTQMTLKTFHFAGVASMNVTMGVPRIKEIINAAKSIHTPIVTAPLDAHIRGNLEAVRIIKGRVEKTLLGEVASSIREVYNSDSCYFQIDLDLSLISELKLEIDIEHVRAALFEAKLKLKDKHVQTKGRDALRVFPPESKYDRMLQSMQLLKQSLPNVVVRGLKSVNRAVISVTEASKKRSDGAKEYELLVEGSDLRGVMGISGVNGEKTTCNHIMEVEKRLGIEAARRTIVAQISETMGSHGLFVDERHLMLLADVMCYQGEVLGITRFGIAKMKQSVLMLASFEKTVDYLFNAAVHGLKDTICGVSECIIMGVPMPVGTGVFKLVQRMHDNKTRAAKRELLLSGRFTHKLKM